MEAAVGAINRQNHELAAVLNSPTVADGVAVKSDPAKVPVEALLKRRGETTYLFAVGTRDGTATANFQVAGLTGKARARVLGEGRTLEVTDGAFRDTFRPWDVHLYEIRRD
jgi:hypothetical protein